MRVHPFERFRNDSELVKAWGEVLRMPITRTVLNLLRENGPEFVQAAYGLTEVDIARRYGDVGGYARCYQIFNDLGEMWPLRPADIEATYEPPEPQT